MRIILSKYSTTLKDFIQNNKLYLALLAFTAFGAYGFTLSNYSISLDDPYYHYISLRQFSGLRTAITQGRWGHGLLGVLLGLNTSQPFLGNFLGVVFLIVATISWTILFEEVSCKKLRKSELIIFSLIFISYPLINEILIFDSMSTIMGIGYLLVGISLLISYESIYKNTTRLGPFLVILLMSIAISIYESFAPVFLSGALCIILLEFLFDEKKERKVLNYGLLLGRFILLLFGSLVFKTIVSTILKKIILGTYGSAGGADNKIMWFSPDNWITANKTLFGSVYTLLKRLGHDFIYNGLFYLPIFVFVIMCAVSLVLAVVMCRKFRSILPPLFFLGLIMSNFSIALIQGFPTEYSACQPMAIFVAFIAMYSCILIRSRKRALQLVLVLLSVLVFWQVRDLNLWFYNDFRRFEMDRIHFVNLAENIERHCGRYPAKPVVFVGQPADYYNLLGDKEKKLLIFSWLPENFLPRHLRVGHVNGYSLFNRKGGESLDGTPLGHPEFFRFMEIYGFKFSKPTINQASQAMEWLSKNKIPSYPQDGFVKEFPEFVIVNMGNED